MDHVPIELMKERSQECVANSASNCARRVHSLQRHRKALRVNPPNAGLNIFSDLLLIVLIISTLKINVLTVVACPYGTEKEGESWQLYKSCFRGSLYSYTSFPPAKAPHLASNRKFPHIWNSKRVFLLISYPTPSSLAP